MATTIKNAHVRNERVEISISRDGTMKHRLIIETNLAQGSAELHKLTEEIAEYLNKHTELDGADVRTIATPN